jgi:hypothetical protein
LMSARWAIRVETAYWRSSWKRKAKAAEDRNADGSR